MHPVAYIDPGAGSLIIQTIIAAAVSVPFVFRKTLRRMLRRAPSDKAVTRETSAPDGTDGGD